MFDQRLQCPRTEAERMPISVCIASLQKLDAAGTNPTVFIGTRSPPGSNLRVERSATRILCLVKRTHAGEYPHWNPKYDGPPPVGWCSPGPYEHRRWIPFFEELNPPVL